MDDKKLETKEEEDLTILEPLEESVEEADNEMLNNIFIPMFMGGGPPHWELKPWFTNIQDETLDNHAKEKDPSEFGG